MEQKQRMDKIPNQLIDKFLSGKRLSDNEYILLDKLFNNSHYHQQVVHWLEEHWQNSQPEDVELQFKQIREKIRISSFKAGISRLFTVWSKAAAILIIPLLAAALYFYFNQVSPEGMLSLSTQKGEQTSVILPDGSKVWINVDTKLSYPVDYGVKSRQLELEGEAYFEVEKNEELPFEVTSGNVVTKALGTRFIVSAYPGAFLVKSSLVEGSVEVEYGMVSEILTPGKQIIFNKKKSTYVVKFFDEDYELAWKNDELVFRLTPFGNVVAELEKWYDVKIEYNPAQFKSETLTVRFEKYETLEQILEVLAKANEFKYTIEDKNVKIMKSRKGVKK
ncbi:MAG: FecR domain-containing protein [Bacteroidota bacterium]